MSSFNSQEKQVMTKSSTPDLDALVPFYRRQARRVEIVVQDQGETDSNALIVVRIIFQRGGGKRYYVLKHIDQLQQFYPKEMGQSVIDAALLAWVEWQLSPANLVSRNTLAARQHQMDVSYEEY